MTQTLRLEDVCINTVYTFNKNTEVSIVNQKGVLRTGDVASICKCSHDTVKRWLEGKQLHGYRLPPHGQWRILPDDLIEFMEKQGLPIDDEARAILGLPQPPIKDFVYCWEFHKRNKTRASVEGRTCEDCLVFRTKARHCFVLREDASVEGIFCRGPCEECDYYRFVTEMDLRRPAAGA